MFRKHKKYCKISKKRAKNLLSKEIDWYYLKIKMPTRIYFILEHSDKLTKEDILDIVADMKTIMEPVFYDNYDFFKD